MKSLKNVRATMFTWTTRPWPLIGLVLALSGCAAQNGGTSGARVATAGASSGAGHCFRAADVNGWRAGGQQAVYLRVGVNRVFRMQLMGPCPDINWSEDIGIEATGSPWICSGIDATIISPSPIGPRRCPVTGLQELSPSELAALPPGQRP
jgi:hypothetical protein